jgi:hypothetical protein
MPIGATLIQGRRPINEDLSRTVRHSMEHFSRILRPQQPVKRRRNKRFVLHHRAIGG